MNSVSEGQHVPRNKAEQGRVIHQSREVLLILISQSFTMVLISVIKSFIIIWLKLKCENVLLSPILPFWTVGQKKQVM